MALSLWCSKYRNTFEKLNSKEWEKEKKITKEPRFLSPTIQNLFTNVKLSG